MTMPQPDQPVRVVCPECKGRKVFLNLEPCLCATGTILATLADPEIAQLIEDGKNHQFLLEHVGEAKLIWLYLNSIDLSKYGIPPVEKADYNEDITIHPGPRSFSGDY